MLLHSGHENLAYSKEFLCNFMILVSTTRIEYIEYKKQRKTFLCTKQKLFHVSISPITDDQFKSSIDTSRALSRQE